MVTIVVLPILATLAFALWLVAAFALRLGHLARLVATLGGPALVAAAAMWAHYLNGRHPGTEPGWDAIFAIVSLLAGAAVLVCVLPVWFVAEDRLGWRARP